MTHVSQGTLLAFIDGELEAAERQGVDRHLEECARCASELERLRTAADELSTLLHELDAPLPFERARSEARKRAQRVGGRRTPGEGAGGRWLRAAGVVLALSGVASAALPGSPVRGWAGDAWRTAAERLGVAGQAAPDSASGTRDEASPAASGVAVHPVDGRAVVLLRRLPAGSRIRVRLGQGPQVRVSAMGRADGVRYGTAPGRIELDGAGVAAVTIVLPRGITRAEVVVDGRPYLRKRGDDLRLLQPPADSGEAELLFRVGRRGGGASAGPRG